MNEHDEASLPVMGYPQIGVEEHVKYAESCVLAEQPDFTGITKPLTEQYLAQVALVLGEFFHYVPMMDLLERMNIREYLEKNGMPPRYANHLQLIDYAQAFDTSITTPDFWKTEHIRQQEVGGRPFRSPKRTVKFHEKIEQIGLAGEEQFQDVDLPHIQASVVTAVNRIFSHPLSAHVFWPYVAIREAQIGTNEFTATTLKYLLAMQRKSGYAGTDQAAAEDLGIALRTILLLGEAVPNVTIDLEAANAAWKKRYDAGDID